MITIIIKFIKKFTQLSPPLCPSLPLSTARYSVVHRASLPLMFHAHCTHTQRTSSIYHFDGAMELICLFVLIFKWEYSLQSISRCSSRLCHSNIWFYDLWNCNRHRVGERDTDCVSHIIFKMKSLSNVFVERTNDYSIHEVIQIHSHGTALQSSASWKWLNCNRNGHVFASCLRLVTILIRIFALSVTCGKTYFFFFHFLRKKIKRNPELNLSVKCAINLWMTWNLN